MACIACNQEFEEGANTMKMPCCGASYHSMCMFQNVIMYHFQLYCPICDSCLNTDNTENDATHSNNENIQATPMHEELLKRGFVCTTRTTKGQDILAACGQLKSEYEKLNLWDQATGLTNRLESL